MATDLRTRNSSSDMDGKHGYSGHLVRSDSFNSLNGDSENVRNANGYPRDRDEIEDLNDDLTAGPVKREISRSLSTDKQDDSEFYSYISPGVKANDRTGSGGQDDGGFRLHIPSMYSKDSEQVGNDTTADVDLDEELPDVEEAQKRREMRRLSRGNSVGSKQSSGLGAARLSGISINDSDEEGLLKIAASLSRKLSSDAKNQSSTPKASRRALTETALKSPEDVKPEDVFKLTDDLDDLEKELMGDASDNSVTPSIQQNGGTLGKGSSGIGIGKRPGINGSQLDGILGGADNSLMHALTGHVPFGDASYQRSTSMLEVSDYSSLPPPSPKTQPDYLSTSPSASTFAQPGFSLRSAATEFLSSAPPPSTPAQNRSPLNRSMSNISMWSDTESNCSTSSRVKDIADKFGGQQKGLRRQLSLASAPGYSSSMSAKNDSKSGLGGGGGGGSSSSLYGGRSVRKAESMGGTSMATVRYAADLENRLQGLMKPSSFVAPKQPLWMRSERERRRKIASEARKKWNMSDYGQLTTPQVSLVDNEHNNLKFRKALKKFRVIEGSQVSDLEAQEARWKSVFEDKAAIFEAKAGEKEIDVRNKVRRSLSNRSLLRQMSIESEKGLDDIY
eukprot:TRINITY_DN2960_c0_g1_i1.p1 TRINITY_DN2960_c0_g1~~TRINITY_DN2960_c0_g1_i1.p1  ORF type:complete len:618 (-),score=105.28 TRINITY_DN2960_c0_g1_i1:876-2729(-)